MREAAFDRLVDGKQVKLYTLKNAQGMVCRITNFGGRIVELSAPDARGELADVVLGYDNLEDYLYKKETYFGAIVGPVANRISGAHFSIDGELYSLSANEGSNLLHSGDSGFHRKVWNASQPQENMLELHLSVTDGDGGFPGNREIKVVYTLTEQNEVIIQFTATTDAPTPVNLTNHSYFNLKGAGCGTIEDHILTLHASRFAGIGNTFIPTGQLKEVANTPFDFREPAALAERLWANDEQLRLGLGFDHHFLAEGSGLRLAARMEEPQSGRTLEVLTDQPGVQFYSGNFLDGTSVGKGNKPYTYRSAFCFETQHHPDSVNRPEFPSVVFRPGDEYRATCVYRFGVSGR